MSIPPRCEIIDETKLGFYHCRSKCVRGEFLCGKDNKTGKDFSHRMDWIWERLVKLAGLFAIDVTFVAVLGNHLHLLLRNRPDIVKQWTEEEIMRRAVLIFPYRFKAFGGYNGGPTTRQLRDLVADKEQVDEMRARLSSISWLMRQLNQQIARQANAQDEVTGHFWEGRFKATPVLDTLGLLVCAMYVDLNVVRAGVADTPEDSFHTSAAARIRGMKARQQDDSQAAQCDGWLSRLSLLSDEQPGYPPAGELGGLRASDNGVLDMTSPDYLQLLDFAGRCVRADKRGRIPDHLAPILERTGLTESSLDLCLHYEQIFTVAVAGSARTIEDYNRRRGRRWTRGAKQLRKILPN